MPFPFAILIGVIHPTVKTRGLSHTYYRKMRVNLFILSCGDKFFSVQPLSLCSTAPRHHFNLNWVRRCIFISVAPTTGLRLSRVSYVSHNLRLGISLHWRYPSVIIGPLVFKVVCPSTIIKRYFSVPFNNSVFELRQLV